MQEEQDVRGKEQSKKDRSNDTRNSNDTIEEQVMGKKSIEETQKQQYHHLQF
jgi:hypothetical protein